jgi:hypothetical protein
VPLDRRPSDGCHSRLGCCGEMAGRCVLFSAGRVEGATRQHANAHQFRHSTFPRVGHFGASDGRSLTAVAWEKNGVAQTLDPCCPEDNCSFEPRPRALSLPPSACAPTSSHVKCLAPSPPRSWERLEGHSSHLFLFTAPHHSHSL